MDDESHETSSPIVTPAPTDAEVEESATTSAAPTFQRPPPMNEISMDEKPILTPAPTDAESEEGPAERLDDDASSAHTTVLFTATTAVVLLLL